MDDSQSDAIFGDTKYDDVSITDNGAGTSETIKLEPVSEEYRVVGLKQDSSQYYDDISRHGQESATGRNEETRKGTRSSVDIIFSNTSCGIPLDRSEVNMTEMSTNKSPLLDSLNNTPASLLEHDQHGLRDLNDISLSISQNEQPNGAGTSETIKFEPVSEEDRALGLIQDSSQYYGGISPYCKELATHRNEETRKATRSSVDILWSNASLDLPEVDMTQTRTSKSPSLDSLNGSIPASLLKYDPDSYDILSDISQSEQPNDSSQEMCFAEPTTEFIDTETLPNTTHPDSTTHSLQEEHFHVPQEVFKNSQLLPHKRKFADRSIDLYSSEPVDFKPLQSLSRHKSFSCKEEPSETKPLQASSSCTSSLSHVSKTRHSTESHDMRKPRLLGKEEATGESLAQKSREEPSDTKSLQASSPFTSSLSHHSKTLHSTESHDMRKSRLLGKEESARESLAQNSQDIESAIAKGLADETSNVSPSLVRKGNGQSQSSTTSDWVPIDTPNDSGDEDFLKQSSSSAETKFASLGAKIIEILDDDTNDNEEENVFLPNLDSTTGNKTKTSDIETNLPNSQFQSEKMYKEALRTELRYKIQLRQEFGDLPRGKNVIQSVSAPDAHPAPTKEQIESEEKRRERNRKHAKMSRQRAKSERAALEQENEKLEQMRSKLLTKNTSLENTYSRVNDWLSSHFVCGLRVTYHSGASVDKHMDFDDTSSQTEKPKSISVLPYSGTADASFSSPRQGNVKKIKRFSGTRIDDSLKDDDVQASHPFPLQRNLDDTTEYKSGAPPSYYPTMTDVHDSRDHSASLIDRDFPKASDSDALKHTRDKSSDTSQKHRDPAWILRQMYQSMNEDYIEHQSPWQVGSSHRKDKIKRVKTNQKPPTRSETSPVSTPLLLQQPGVKSKDTDINPQFLTDKVHSLVKSMPRVTNIETPPITSKSFSHNTIPLIADIPSSPVPSLSMIKPHFVIIPVSKQATTSLQHQFQRPNINLEKGKSQIRLQTERDTASNFAVAPKPDIVPSAPKISFYPYTSTSSSSRSTSYLTNQLHQPVNTNSTKPPHKVETKYYMTPEKQTNQNQTTRSSQPSQPSSTNTQTPQVTFTPQPHRIRIPDQSTNLICIDECSSSSSLSPNNFTNPQEHLLIRGRSISSISPTLYSPPLPSLLGGMTILSPRSISPRTYASTSSDEFLLSPDVKSPNDILSP